MTETEMRVNWRRMMKKLLKIKRAAIKAGVVLEQIQEEIDDHLLDVVDEADLDMVENSVGVKARG